MDPSKLSNAQVTFIFGEDGNVLDTVSPSEETATAWKTNKQIYKDDSGNWTAVPQASVSMAANGDINVVAPKSYFSNESLKNLMDESALSQISKLYKANPDAKISNPFNSKEGEEITIPDFIKSFDNALKDYANIQYGTELTRYSQREDLGDKAKNLTENQYIIMNTTATEPGAKAESYLAVPTSILEAFPNLKNLGSYNNNFFTRGDFLNEFYNLDKTSREDIHKVHDIVDEYFAKKDFSDLDEYSRMYAFRQFIKTIEPSAGFWSTVGLSAESGVVGGATGLAKFGTGVMNLLETAWNGVMFLNQFSPFQLPATVATGVKGYGDPRIGTSVFKGLDEGLQQHISEQQQSYYELQHNAAAIYTLSEMGAEIAANIATGKAIANVITNSALLKSAQEIATETGEGIDLARALGGTTGNTARAIGTAAPRISTAEALNARLLTNLTGTANPNKLQLLKALATTDGSYIYNSIDSLVRANALTSYGLGNIAANAASQTGAFVSTAGASADAAYAISETALAASKNLESMLNTSLQTLRSSLGKASVENFFAQVAVDTATYDALAWRKYLDSDPDAADLGELLWRSGINAGIYAGALGLGRLITKFPATETAQKANVKARKAVYSTAETVSKWGDDVKDHLPAVLKNRMSNSASMKRAVQYADLLRGANKIVAETGDITKKVAMEAALDDMWFGVNNEIATYHSDFYPFMKQSNEARADSVTGLNKLLNEAGVAPEAPIAFVGKGTPSNWSLPQDLIDYAYDLDLVRRAKTYTPDAIAEMLANGKKVEESRKVAEARIARVKEKYPVSITDYIERTWVSARYDYTYQGNRIADENHVIDKPWYEGVVSSGHFGDNGELWLPARTITEYQELQKDARNSLSRELIGDVPNKNQPEKWSYAWDGKEHHYVHPDIVIDNYIRSIASRSLRRRGLIAGLDIYGQDVIFTGEQNTAAQAYKNNRSQINKAVNNATRKVANTLASSGLAKRVSQSLDIKKQQKKIAKKEDRIEALRSGEAEVKVNKTDMANVVNTLSNEQLELMLGDSAVITATQTDDGWKDFWKNASSGMRKDIRLSLESTAMQSGFTLDKRAWLNSLVPGFDVLDWSLLDRTHTNGLFPGGMYGGMEGNDVRAYVMDLEDLRKITGLNKNREDLSKYAIDKIEKDINVKGGKAILPLHYGRTGGSDSFYLQTRWGHSGDKFPDWETYLNYLESQGVKKVPVAVEATTGYDDQIYALRNSGIAQEGLDSISRKLDEYVATTKVPEFTPRELSAAHNAPGQTWARIEEKIRHSVPEEALSTEEWVNLKEKADAYDWNSDEELMSKRSREGEIQKALDARGITNLTDITSDLQQAQADYGYIPWFHNQHDPLGSAEFNTEPPTGESVYTARGGIGDALWVTPNASYAREGRYGENQTIANIPKKYFMSDKEMKETLDKLIARRDVLDGKAAEKFRELNKKFGDKPAKAVSTLSGAGEQERIIKKGLFPTYNRINGNYVAADYVDFNGNTYARSYQRTPDGEWSDKVFLKPYSEKVPKEQAMRYIFKECKEAFLPKKEAEELRAISKIFDAGDGVSYRALAEYTGKPVIDTTRDMGAQGINGTAFFYYKGANPEFDKELGDQLQIQAQGTPDRSEAMRESQLEYLGETMSFPQLLEDLAGDDSIAKAKLADIKRLAEDIESYIYSDPDMKAKREIELDDKISELTDLRRGKAPGLSEYVFETKQINQSKATRPTLSKWVLGKEDLLEHIHAWNIDDETYDELAEFYDLGEYITPEEKAKWAAIDPTNPDNVPVLPEDTKVKLNPRTPISYDVFHKGLDFDPELERKLNQSLLSNKIKKECM